MVLPEELALSDQNIVQKLKSNTNAIASFPDTPPQNI